MSVSRQNAFNAQFRLEPLIKRIPSMDAAKVEKAGLVQQQALHNLPPSNFIQIYLVFLLLIRFSLPNGGFGCGRNHWTKIDLHV